MAHAIIMPKLGLTMASGVVTEWYVKEGDRVALGQPLFAIETDKITTDVESTAEGTVLRIVAKAGDTKKITEPCCYVGEAEEAPPGAPEPAAAAVPAAAAAPEPDLQSEADALRVMASPRARKLAADIDVDIGAVPYKGERRVGGDVLAFVEARRVKITPAAKKRAAELGLDASSVPGSGPNGRVQRKDVEAAGMLAPPASAPATAASPTAAGKAEKMSGMRRTIASRLTMSKQTIPHTYYRREVDASGLIAAKNMIADAALAKNGVKLTLNDFILKAAAQALDEFADVNAQTDGECIRYFDTVDLGFAVSLHQGLIVPVIRSAERLSLSEISKQAARLATKARQGRLEMDECSGGSFTVSNLGSLGMDEFCAVINPPESGILAVGAVKERPVAIDGEIAVRPMMWITGSFDHRLIDGVLAARFMQRLTELLENAPALLV